MKQRETEEEQRLQKEREERQNRREQREFAEQERRRRDREVRERQKLLDDDATMARAIRNLCQDCTIKDIVKCGARQPSSRI